MEQCKLSKLALQGRCENGITGYLGPVCRWPECNHRVVVVVTTFKVLMSKRPLSLTIAQYSF
jgi:hypothetical protein